MNKYYKHATPLRVIQRLICFVGLFLLGINIGNDDGTAQLSSSINTPPEIIHFDIVPSPAAVGAFVVFVGAAMDWESQSQDLKFLWSFGDGSTSTDYTPVYVYGSTGFFNICLTVLDPQGLQVRKCQLLEVVGESIGSPPPSYCPPGTTGTPPNCVPVQPPGNSNNIVGDVNGDGRVDQADVAALQSALSGGGGFACPTCDMIPIEFYKSEADLTKPCGVINEKDLKALIKALRKIERSKRAPKSKCHGKQRVGTMLSATPTAKLGVQNIQTQVYNLSKELIGHSNVMDNRHIQNFQNNQKQKLANGIYLVVITTRDSSGYLIRREVKKIVVLR